MHESWFGRTMVGNGTLVLLRRRKLLLILSSWGGTSRWDVAVASWVRTELLLLGWLGRAVLLVRGWLLGVVGV